VKILDNLPVGLKPDVLFMGAEAVTIKRYQIAVWARLAAAPARSAEEVGKLN
jgi:hypothetical protein